MHNKVVVVTGAARGMGAAEARLFADHGATVYVTDVLEEDGKEVAKEIRDDGGDATFHHLDVSDEGHWEELMEMLHEKHGRVDVLVNNAAIARLEPITEETVDGWEDVISVNLRGVWLGMKHAIPHMKHSDGDGSIVNISSIYGKVGGSGDSAAYQAAKGGVTVMTKNAAVGYADEGIRVNSIHPGYIKTPMTEPLPDEQKQGWIDATPQGRGAEPEEVAEPVYFLASEKASYINGAELYVDGGYLAR